MIWHIVYQIMGGGPSRSPEPPALLVAPDAWAPTRPTSTHGPAAMVQQPKAYPHPPVPAAGLFLASLGFAAFSST